MNLQKEMQSCYKKKTHYEISYQKCLDLLVKNRNIVCLAREEIVTINILNKLDANYNPVMKILDEVYISMPGVIRQLRSPHISRFNILMSRIQRSGFIEKRFAANLRGIMISTEYWKTSLLF